MDSLSERFKTLHVTLEKDLNPVDRNVHAERLPISVVRKWMFCKWHKKEKQNNWTLFWWLSTALRLLTTGI